MFEQLKHLEMKPDSKYFDYSFKSIDRCETIAEEINLMMGWNCKVIKGKIKVDTIAGPFYYSPSEKTLMGDVYRLISHYGAKLSKYGLENKLKEL